MSVSHKEKVGLIGNKDLQNSHLNVNKTMNEI